MVASFALIRDPGYYTRASAATASAAGAYYLGGDPAKDSAAGIWLRGHERLGVAAGEPATLTAFERLCAGCGPDGQSLVRGGALGTRVAGVDLTLSSLKAVSILYALGDASVRAAIARAERAAVEATLALIERELPLARRGRAGAKREHARFVAAVFTHDESRPEVHADGVVMASPQRHHHLCVPNIAERADGSWGALDTVALRSWKKSLGATFRLELARHLEAAGFAIAGVDAEDDDWRWTVRGVPESLIAYFSARRSKIEEALAEAGVTSGHAPALAAAVTRSARREKGSETLAELTELWRTATSKLGLAPDAVAPVALAAGARDRPWTPAEAEALIVERLAGVPERLTQHDAVFERRHLVEAVANALVGTGADAVRACREADRLVASGAVREIGQGRHGALYSTAAIVEAEQGLVAVAARLARTRVAAAPKLDHVARLISEHDLNGDQAEVVRAATSGTRLVLIQGSAGTGKTTALRPVARAWESAGYRVLGASVAWQAALELGEEVAAADARAIDSWLATAEAEAKRDRSVFDARTVLLVDESGLQASPQARRLLDLVERSGAVCVLVGDERQLRPVGPGHAHRIVRETVGAVALDAVVRQRETWARDAPLAFARGEAGTALEAYDRRGLVREHDGPRATMRALVDDWAAARRDEPHRSHLLLAKTNAEAIALGALAREALRADGVITGPEVRLPAVTPSRQAYELRLATGDRVRFLLRQNCLGVVNGTLATVLAVEAGEGGCRSITACVDDGREVHFTPREIADRRGRARLAVANAATLFQAQGLTCEQAFVLVTDRFDRHDAYVAASRARGDTHLYLDRRGLDRSLRASEQIAVVANDPADGAVDRAHRLAFLARQLARAAPKTTTLDVTRAALGAEGVDTERGVRTAGRERDDA